MFFTDLKVGTRVGDSWYPLLGTGVVQKTYKTVVYICFKGGKIIKYDRPHCQFLRRAP